MRRRVLITTPGSLGHVHPMVPLATALMARGHDVLWAVPPAGLPHVERRGIPAVAAGNADAAGPALAMQRYPELRELPVADRPRVLFGKIFGAMAAPPMLADLVAGPLQWQPDLVVCDAAELAGHILAAELGVPSATRGFGPLLPEERVAAAAVEVAPLWQSRGLEPRPYAGCYDHLYLDIYPPLLQREVAPHVPHRQLLRPLADDGREEGSGAFDVGDPGRPLVYVTMGTVFNDPQPLRVILAALAELELRLLVTVGPHADPALLGPQPPHVRVEPYVPQSLVLGACDLVISHGGSGTVLATLARGLPQLCLPQGADQFLNGEAVAAGGAGLSLPPDAATADAVRDAVQQLLHDPSFREAARGVSASIGSMPSPDEVAAVLESLT